MTDVIYIAMGVGTLAIAAAIWWNIRRSDRVLGRAGAALLAFLLITGLVDLSLAATGATSSLTIVLDVAALTALGWLGVSAGRLAMSISRLEQRVIEAEEQRAAAVQDAEVAEEDRRIAMHDRLAGPAIW